MPSGRSYRFSKIGMAIFISMDSKEQDGCQGREREEKNSNLNGLHYFGIEDGFKKGKCMF
jgi:hypothetical protein